MYKVLLVDDEHYDLEGLKQLVPWAQLRLHVVDAVHSGSQALQVIDQTADLDLLITDVMMPRMTGLELAMKARERLPRLKIVFLSGYQEFEFARRAIELSAAAYILKPMNDEDLLRVLGGVVEQLEHEQEDRQLERMSQGELLYQWLEELVPDDQQATVGARLALPSPGDGGYRAAIVEIDDVQWRLNQYGPRERERMVNETVKALRRELAERPQARFCRLSKYQFALVFASRPDDLTWLQAVREAAPPAAGLTVTIALGGRVQRFAEIVRSYQEAKEILGYKLFVGKNRTIGAADKQHLAHIETGDLDAAIQRLFTATTNHDLPLMERSLAEVFAITYQFQHTFSVHSFAMHLVSRLEASLQRLNQSLYALLQIEYKDLDILFQFETIDDIKLWLRAKMLELSELLQSRRQHRHSRLIEEIERCIEEKLTDKATLRAVARHFSFSPNYLSHVFKEETGEKFSTYIVRKRLEKACELLRTTNLKVFEISDLLGYSTVTYFSRQFRNAYGMTPGDFRKQSAARPGASQAAPSTR